MGSDTLDDRLSIEDERSEDIDPDERVSGGGGGGGGGGFRVRVSLERFFSDERARVLVWAPRARPAGWLLRRLRAALPLPPAPRLALSAGGYLLPPAEPLAVLRPDDLLQVIISPDERQPAGEESPAPAVEERRALAAVKRRALRLLDEVAGAGEAGAGEEGAPGPRRRRRVRRRRAAPPRGDGDAWRAEPAAAAGVLRSTTPPRVPRLVAAAH